MRLIKNQVGWKVHTWAYPIIWWARRKPRSRFRQWLWTLTDIGKSKQTLRYRRKLRRMSNEELQAHLEKRWGKR